MTTFYAAPVFFLAVLLSGLKISKEKITDLAFEKKIPLTHGLHLNMPRGLIVLFKYVE